MVFKQTPRFTRRIVELMSDEDYLLLQLALLLKPDKGAIIQRSGGLRKLR